jgi:hypothetical protein
MVNKVFILAFNHHEAKSFVNKNEGSYIVLNSPDQLSGTYGANVKIMPNAYRREDYLDMIESIRLRHGNIVR